MEPISSERVASEPTESRANNFDFLRYVFACVVILFHALLYLHQPNTDEVLWRYTRGQQDSGSLAVNGFFAISGFLITASWLLASAGKARDGIERSLSALAARLPAL